MFKGDLVLPSEELSESVNWDSPAIVIKEPYGIVTTRQTRWDGKVTISEETKVVDILHAGKIYTEIPVQHLYVVKIERGKEI